MADVQEIAQRLEAALRRMKEAQAKGDSGLDRRAQDAIGAIVWEEALQHARYRKWHPDGGKRDEWASKLWADWKEPEKGRSGFARLIEAYDQGKRGEELYGVVVRKLRDAWIEAARKWDRENRPLLPYLEYKIKALVQEEHHKGPGERRLKFDPPTSPGMRNANRWVLLDRWPPDPRRRRLAIDTEPPLSSRVEGGPDATGCELPEAPIEKPKKGFRLPPGGPKVLVGWIACTLERLDGTMRPSSLALRLYNLFDKTSRAIGHPDLPEWGVSRRGAP